MKRMRIGDDQCVVVMSNPEWETVLAGLRMIEQMKPLTTSVDPRSIFATPIRASQMLLQREETDGMDFG